MNIFQAGLRKDAGIMVAVGFLLIISFLVLRSIAPFVYPVYFIYIAAAILAFFIFSQIDFDAISVFYVYFYIWSVLILIVPLIVGQVTRGAIRWIPIGPIAIQPAELVRPFLLVFFAKFLSGYPVNFKKFMQANVLFLVPFLLILIQPSLGVALITAAGYFGVVLASSFSKKTLVGFLIAIVALSPIFWQVLADYQKERVASFLNSSGSSYNALQAMIAVGSGKLVGSGLGKGVETQLAFLPEKHTDFIFASIAEELGLLGAFLILLCIFFLLYRIVKILENSRSVAARMFISGIFLTLIIEVIIHVGMNMGMLPITGLPLPLVSAGGSSLVATMTALGMVIGAKKS